MSSDITVVIPTYNRPQLVLRALESAYAQTLLPDKIIVMDDGSNEIPSTKRLLDDRLMWGRTSRPDNVYLSWYEAINMAPTTYVMLLADDDWMEPEFLQRAKSMFHDEVAFVYSQATIHFPDGTIKHNCVDTTPSGYHKIADFESMILDHEYTLTPHCCLFRRADHMRSLLVGPFPGHGINHFIKCGNDLLMILLILLDKRYNRIGYIKEPLINLDAHDQSTTIDAMHDEKKLADLKAIYQEARDFYRRLK